MSLENLLPSQVVDLLDKVHTPASRAGNTVERVAALIEAGITPEAVATQMTSTSSSGQVYNTQSILALVSLYEDCKTRAPLTKKAIEALIQDQQQYGFSPAGTPA